MLTTEFYPWCWWPWGLSKIGSAMCLHIFTCLHPHCTCSHISVDPNLLKSFTQRASVLHEVLRNEAQVSMLLKKPTYHAFFLINVSGNWSTSRAPTPCTGCRNAGCELCFIWNMHAGIIVCVLYSFPRVPVLSCTLSYRPPLPPSPLVLPPPLSQSPHTPSPLPTVTNSSWEQEWRNRLPWRSSCLLRYC